MQNTDESVDSIYIIEIPVTAVAWCGKGGKKESFSVVQVGKTSNGARGMKNRMGQHNLAWCYASGSKETYSTVNSISEPSKAEHYTVDAIHRFPCIIGAMVVRGDESTSYWERRIRKRIGVTLSETMVTDLLSKPFDSDFGGATVLEKGGKGNFSLTELCLVSKKEVSSSTMYQFLSLIVDIVVDSSRHFDRGSMLNGLMERPCTSTPTLSSHLGGLKSQEMDIRSV